MYDRANFCDFDLQVIFYEKNKILPIAKPKLQFHIKIDWAYLENLKLIELTLKM